MMISECKDNVFFEKSDVKCEEKEFFGEIEGLFPLKEDGGDGYKPSFSIKNLHCNYYLVTFATSIEKMSSKEKLRARFFQMPSDFTFDEMQQLLAGYGYVRGNKGHTSGSRVIFKNKNKKPIMLHQPHPGNIVKVYAMKQVYQALKEEGLI